MSIHCRYVFLLLVTFLHTAYGAIGTDCSENDDADCDAANNEVCDSETTQLCTCDSGNDYVDDGGDCLKDCGSTSSDTMYTVDPNPASTLEGATAEVSCAAGYEGTPADIECQVGGTWESPSGCSIKDCGTPTPETGYSATPDGATTYQGTASVVCDTGNGYSGTPASLTCEASGSWSAYSGCTLGGAVDCGNPPAETGYVPEASPSTTQGSTATVTCDSGYSGTPNSITCEASGSWSTYSGCTKDCGSTSSDTMYTVDPNPASTLEGATAEVSCAAGYEGTPADIECQVGGTWESPSGCSIKDCGTPTPETGYSATPDGATTYQGTASVVCDTGNGYSGTPASLTCEASGSWSAYSGCTLGGAVDCGNPPAETGYVPEASPSTTQGSTATVTCDSGYSGTPNSITCEASGSWSTYSGCTKDNSGSRQSFSLLTLFATIILTSL